MSEKIDELQAENVRLQKEVAELKALLNQRDVELNAWHATGLNFQAYKEAVFSLATSLASMSKYAPNVVSVEGK